MGVAVRAVVTFFFSFCQRTVPCRVPAVSKSKKKKKGTEQRFSIPRAEGEERLGCGVGVGRLILAPVEY